MAKKHIMKNKKYKFYTFFFIVCYRCILELVYSHFISPVYSYAGYVNNACTSQYLFSWLFFIILSFAFIKALFGKDRFWKYVSFIILCLKFVPLTVLIAYVEYPTEYISQTFVFWLFFIVGYNILPSFKTIDVKFIQKNERIFKNLLFVLISLFTISVLFVSIKYTGFRLHTSLFDVYDIRFEQRGLSYPKIFNYLLAASSVLCPLILCYFLDKKKYIYAILFCFIIYIDFSIGGLKSIVFITIIALVIRAIYTPKLLYSVPIIACTVLVTIFSLNDTLQFALSFIIWRALFVPSGMDFEYYTFFNLFEPDYYRNSILRRIGFDSPYASSSVDIAVGEYFNPEIEGIRANNGLISEAYANFGVNYYFLFPIILIIYIKLLSSFAKYTVEKYLLLISIVFAYAIISTFIPATFMSSGVLYMIFFLISYSNKQNGNNIAQNY